MRTYGKWVGVLLGAYGLGMAIYWIAPRSSEAPESLRDRLVREIPLALQDLASDLDLDLTGVDPQVFALEHVDSLLPRYKEALAQHREGVLDLTAYLSAEHENLSLEALQQQSRASLESARTLKSPLPIQIRRDDAMVVLIVDETLWPDFFPQYELGSGPRNFLKSFIYKSL